VIDTGIPILQRNLGGLERQTLTIIAARPSMGKTALALQLAMAAADSGAKVAFFSLEMSRMSLFGRMACGAAEISYVDYRARRLSAEQETNIKDCAEDLIEKYEGRITINDKTNTKTEDLWRFCAEVRPDVIFVDHLSKVADVGDNEVRRLGHVSWGGKQLAKEFDLSSVYLMQLNRQLENREQKEPKLSDLRDSGEIEQDADVVLFVHRPDYYEQPLPNQVMSRTKLIIGKDRNGARNYAMPMMYHMRKQKFYEETK
jgi:replicative DNA helicase